MSTALTSRAGIVSTERRIRTAAAAAMALPSRHPAAANPSELSARGTKRIAKPAFARFRAFRISHPARTGCLPPTRPAKPAPSPWVRDRMSAPGNANAPGFKKLDREGFAIKPGCGDVDHPVERAPWNIRTGISRLQEFDSQIPCLPMDIPHLEDAVLRSRDRCKRAVLADRRSAGNDRFLQFRGYLDDPFRRPHESHAKPGHGIGLRHAGNDHGAFRRQFRNARIPAFKCEIPIHFVWVANWGSSTMSSPCNSSNFKATLQSERNHW